MKRKQNQDNFLLEPDIRLFVVADGMGGHKGGETASFMAVNKIAEYLRSPAARGISSPALRIQNAVLAANGAIQAKGQEDVSLQGMGTTAVALYFCEDRLFIGHVGDSRCYMLHPKRIWQVTRDHSLVQEKLRAGLIDRAELKTDRMKNVITRSVGFEPDLDVDVYEVEPHPGDVFVVCSDGLSGMIDDSDIRDIVQSLVFEQDLLDEAVKKLIDAANEHGGDDNVTAVIVRVV